MDRDLTVLTACQGRHEFLHTDTNPYVRLQQNVILHREYTVIESHRFRRTHRSIGLKHAHTCSYVHAHTPRALQQREREARWLLSEECGEQPSAKRGTERWRRRGEGREAGMKGDTAAASHSAPGSRSVEEEEEEGGGGSEDCEEEAHMDAEIVSLTSVRNFKTLPHNAMPLVPSAKI